MTEEHFSDPEAAAEAGRLSGAIRRRKASMTPEERALDAIGRKLGPLTKELLDAALGEGDFASRVEEYEEDGETKRVFIPGLKPETRLSAILRAMEWKLGKAPTAKRSEPEAETETPTAETVFGS